MVDQRDRGRAIERVGADRAPRCVAALARGIVLLLGITGAVRADDPRPIPDDALPELAEKFSSGDEAVAAALRAQGPSIVARLRPLLPEEAAPRLRRLIDEVIRDDLRRSLVEEGQVRYRGQFSELSAVGPEGAEILLLLFADEDTPFDLRNRAATALGDVGGDAQLPALRSLADDYLAEEWVEREATFLLARFGDRERVERRLERLRGIADQELTTTTLPTILTAHGQMAEVHYRIDEFDAAITHYLKKQALLEEMKDRVRPELREPLQREIDVLQYNLACSLALGGRIDESFAALDRSMASRDITLDMVRTDGDLRAVRADPRYPERLAEWERMRAGKRETPDEPDRGAESGDPPTE